MLSWLWHFFPHTDSLRLLSSYVLVLVNQFKKGRTWNIRHRCLILSLLSITSHCSYCCPSALPAFFKEGLKNREATDGATATLHCELSKVGVPVEWKKGEKTLKPSDKYRMRQENTAAELLIRDLEVEDTGEYTCVCGDQKTSAVLTVHGKKAILGYDRSISRGSLFSERFLFHLFWFCSIFLVCWLCFIPSLLVSSHLSVNFKLMAL